MTALTRTPENTGFLQPTKFLLVFDRMPTVQYFCQQINLPGVNLPQIDRETPFVALPIPATKLIYNQLNITFIMDEKGQSWQDIYNWFRAIAAPPGFDERNRLTALQNQFKTNSLTSYSDATLTLLTALNNPIIRIQFFNAFPIALQDINFDTGSSADTILTGLATFVYDYYDFIPV